MATHGASFAVEVAGKVDFLPLGRGVFVLPAFGVVWLRDGASDEVAKKLVVLVKELELIAT